MKSFDVVAAIIIYNQKILCVQRGKGNHSYLAYKYEFPGGKVEQGETEQQAIIREIKEELDLEISVQKKFLSVQHSYPDITITLHSFLCKCDNPTITLTEHLNYKWLSKDDLKRLEWAEADEPVVRKLVESEIGELF
jgi:8-oxo-dGTP diphosphatase